jgi:Mrp family chromosome partitioning ATPase
MAQHVGGVVLVSSLGDTKRDALRYFRRTMSNAHGTLLGCIVNKVNINKRYGYSGYYQYYGDYGDGKKGKLPAVVDDDYQRIVNS